MSMFSIFNVSGSAVSAQAQRLNVVVDLVVGLRVTEDQEREGLDTVSHGERAYS